MKDNIGKYMEPYKTPKRGWLKSIFGSLLITLAGIIASMLINPLIERPMSWSWLSGISIILFALCAISIRKKWL